MQVERTFAALADPTRRSMLDRLASGERTLSDLAAAFPLTLMAVQKHVRVLEASGLVKTRKIGRSRHVRLRLDGLQHVSDWLRRAEARWNLAFDRLEQALEEENE